MTVLSLAPTEVSSLKNGKVHDESKNIYYVYLISSLFTLIRWFTYV